MAETDARAAGEAAPHVQAGRPCRGLALLHDNTDITVAVQTSAQRRTRADERRPPPTRTRDLDRIGPLKPPPGATRAPRTPEASCPPRHITQ